jgi:hypothetical protein
MLYFWMHNQIQTHKNTYEICEIHRECELISQLLKCEMFICWKTHLHCVTTKDKIVMNWERKRRKFCLSYFKTL